MSAALPFRRSYWVEPHRLLAGFFPGDKDPITATAKCSALIGSGIRLVINLMEESEPDWHGLPFGPYDETLRNCASVLGSQASMLRFPIRDLDVPPASHMSAILDAIDHGLASGGVYVHCRGGRGRTGTTIGCWLVRHGFASPDHVLAPLATLTAHDRASFPRIPETSTQRQFIQSWHRHQ
jgi:hypothetical protein